MAKVRLTARTSTRNVSKKVVKQKTKSPDAAIRKAVLKAKGRMADACRMPRWERSDRRIAVAVGLLEQLASLLQLVADDAKRADPRRPAHAPDRLISADDIMSLGKQAANMRTILGIHGFGSPTPRSPLTAGGILRDLAGRLDWVDHADDLEGGGPAVLKADGKSYYTAEELYPHLSEI